MSKKIKPRSLANLKDQSAPDKPGATVTITIRITPEQKEWLATQQESASYHARQAIDAYIKSKKDD